MIISKYVDLIDQMMMYLPGCPRALILNALRKSGRKFCYDSDAWRETLEMSLVEGICDYSLPLPERTMLKRIIAPGYKVLGGVWQQGVLLSPITDYELVLSKERSGGEDVETVPLGARFLVSGDGVVQEESPNGYYLMSVDEDEYSIYIGNQINFRLFVDHLAVRIILQKTSPANLAGWVLDGTTNPAGEYVAVNGTSSVEVKAVNTSESVLSAPIIRLRLAPSYDCNEGLIACVSVVPEHKHDGLPVALLNNYAEGIICGALDYLLRMPKRSWTDTNLAADFKREFFTAVSRARSAALNQG